MAFDGYFKNTKTVTPRRPITRTSPIIKPPTPTSRPYVPRSPPHSGFDIPAMPKEPKYGTAVPTTPLPAYQGIPRTRQYLRWFMPSAFDQWGYIDSFSYVFEPVRNVPGGWKLPTGWKSCGQLKGAAISQGPGYYPPKDKPYICQLLPMGGQHVPDEVAGTADAYAFFETTFSEPFVGGTYYGFAWRPDNVRPGGQPTPQPGRAVLAPVPEYQNWTGIPRPRRGSRPRPVPWVEQPHRPSAPAPSMGPTRSSRGVYASPPNVLPRPSPRPVAPENPHKPPPRRTKERKFKVPRWFSTLSKVAWEATEAVDVVENLFECLPKNVQKTVKKTGVTMPDAWKPGIKYATAIDKAKHVYSNVDQLDGDCAMRKLACNHVMDMLWGRFFGGVDNAAQRYGLKGYGRAAGSMSGLNLTKKEKEAFDKWISDNPALDALRKSLDCENLGRS